MRLRLGLDRARHLNDALALQMRQVVLRRVEDNRLRESGPVSDYDERNRPEFAHLVQPANQPHFLADVLWDIDSKSPYHAHNLLMPARLSNRGVLCRPLSSHSA